MKRLLASAVAAVLVFLMVLGSASGAGAQDAPPAADPAGGGGDAAAAAEEAPVEEAPPIPDPSPQVAVVLAQLHVLDTQRALADALAALSSVKADEARATAARDSAQRDRDQRRLALAGAAVDAYVRGGTDDALEGVDVSVDDYVPMEAARVLAGTAIDRGQRLLREAEQELARRQSALDAAIARSAAATAARDTAQAAESEAELAVDGARRLTNRTDVSPSVMGESVLTADEIAAWFKAQAVEGYVAAVDVPTLARYYVDEGADEQIRGDIAFAQSMIETGSFTSPLTTRNNFAGIGACDSCETGFDFPSVEKGVRAQAQLLHAYADRNLRRALLANPAVGSNPDNLSVRGCCPTWNKLTGTWATDTNYGPKIMTIYLSMLQFAYQQRLATPAPPPNSGSLAALSPR